MSKYARRLLVPVLGLAVLAGCDDSTEPIATSNVDVRVYIDADNSGDFSAAADVAVQGATVQLASVADPATTLSATTGSEGLATFTDVEIGSYTATLTAGAPAGATLASASSPAVVVEEGMTAEASFRYIQNPGTVTGHAFIGSGSYAEGDLVVADLPVVITGEGVVDTVWTDETGLYTDETLMPGDYTVTVDVPSYLVAASASEDVTVVADESQIVDFGFDTNVTHTIAEARDAAEGDTVSVVGIAITGNAGDSAALSGSSFYLQDASGISIYLGGVSAQVMLGDSVLVYGTRGAYQNEVQISALAAIDFGAGTLPDPVAVTPAQINAGEHQGELAVVQNVLVDSIPMDAGSPTGDVYVSDLVSGEDLHIYVDADAGIDIAAVFTEGSVYDITGVVARYQSDFELKPRMTSDVAEVTPTGMTIQEVRDAANGTSVAVTGVVTAGTEAPGNLASNGFYLQDATAGVFVYTGSSSLPVGLAIGDLVTVTGDRSEYSGIVQISGTVTVTELGVNVIPTPRPVTPAALNAGDYQSELVVVTGVVADSINGSNIWVTDPTDVTEPLLVYLDSDSNVPAAGFAVGNTYDIAGVVSAYGGTAELLPRMPEDVSGTTVVDTLNTVAEARAAEAGTPVELTGVVTMGTGMIDARNAYMQDATAGILIRMPTADSTVAIGDSVTVIGTTGAYASELQINVDALIRLGTGTVPAPRVVTPGDVEAGLYQGELAVLQNVEVTDVSGGTVTVTDGTDTTTVYLDSDTGIDGATTFTVGSSYNVTGLLSRYNDTFELKPRQASDIEAL